MPFCGCTIFSIYFSSNSCLLLFLSSLNFFTNCQHIRTVIFLFELSLHVLSTVIFIQNVSFMFEFSFVEWYFLLEISFHITPTFSFFLNSQIILCNCHYILFKLSFILLKLPYLFKLIFCSNCHIILMLYLSNYYNFLFLRYYIMFQLPFYFVHSPIYFLPTVI